MFRKVFWLAATERAVKTAAQVMLGFLVAGVAIHTLPWLTILSVTATATLASVLTSLVSASSDGNPSMGSVESLDPLEGPVEGAVEGVPASRPEEVVEPGEVDPADHAVM